MSVSELQAASPGLALPPLHLRLLLAQQEYQQAQLSLQHGDLTRGQLLLPAPQQRLLRLLLQGGPRQLLLSRPQLLQGHTRASLPANGPHSPAASAWDPSHAEQGSPSSAGALLTPVLGSSGSQEASVQSHRGLGGSRGLCAALPPQLCDPERASKALAPGLHSSRSLQSRARGRINTRAPAAHLTRQPSGKPSAEG